MSRQKIMLKILSSPNLPENIILLMQPMKKTFWNKNRTQKLSKFQNTQQISCLSFSGPIYKRDKVSVNLKFVNLSWNGAILYILLCVIIKGLIFQRGYEKHFLALTITLLPFRWSTNYGIYYFIYLYIVYID